MDTTAAPANTDTVERPVEGTDPSRGPKGFRRWTAEERAATAELIARATPINVSRFEAL